MPEPIIFKIDVSKIDKARLFKGEKGTYLDCVAWPTDNDQYGNNYRVVQSVSKEERAAGTKGSIIGNGKFMQTRGASAPKPKKEAAKPAEKSEGWDDPNSDDCPF